MRITKSIALILISGVLLGTILFTASHSIQKNQFADQKHPGWFDQFQRMKTGGNGEIPTGLRRQWAEAERQSRAKKQAKEIVKIEGVKELGPTSVGGRTRAILIDKANNDHLLAGSVSGGLWQSFDRGENWEPLNDFADNLSISAITQDHFNPDEIYYSTGEPIGNSAEVPGEGIYKSTDGGSTFQPLPSTLNDTFNSNWDIAASPEEEGVIYVATDEHGLYRSTDAGQTFNQVFSTNDNINPNSGNQSINDIEILPDGTVLIGVQSSGIYKSSNGSDFKKINDNFPSNGNYRRVKLAYCRENPEVIYSIFINTTRTETSVQGLWKTTDTGNTWQEMTNPDDNPELDFSLGWYALALEVKPDNPDILFTGSVNAGYSLDGGQTWQKAYNSHADYHTLRTFPDNANKVLVGNDGGIYEYQWDDLTSETATNDLNEGYQVTQFYAGHYFPEGPTTLGGTQDNGTHGIIDPDSGFKKLYGADGGYAFIHQQNPDTGYVSSQYGRIQRTYNIRDSHPSFTSVYENIEPNVDDRSNVWFINPFQMNPVDGNQIYYVTKSEIFRTLDGGSNWEEVTEDLNQIDNNFNNIVPYTIAVSEEENPTAYVGGENKLFFRIDDAATAKPGEETNLTSTVPPQLEQHFLAALAIQPNQPSTVYAGFSNYDSASRIWKVKNAKTNDPQWESFDKDLPEELPINSIATGTFNDTSMIMAGTDFGVYITKENATSWQKIDAVPNVSVHQIRFRSSDNTLFAFTHGRGVWQINISEEDQTPIESEKPLIVYPNPTIDKVQLSLSNTPDEQIQSIALVDISGKLLTYSEKDHAENLTRINMANYKAGLYWLRVKTSEDVYSRKIIKQ